MTSDSKTPTSFRLSSDIIEALRKLRDETGESMSDLLRRGALMVLGICPTCGKPENDSLSNESGNSHE